MTLAIFDLDNTLLNGDSDHAWGEFIIAEGLVDAEQYRHQNDAFYQQYLIGTLDIYAYQNFCLNEIAKIEPSKLNSLLKKFLETVIKDMIGEKTLSLIKKHQTQKHQLLIITATNEVITRPIADYLGIEELIATQAETFKGKLSGKVAGVASYAKGKITRLEQWMTNHPEQTLEGSYFYSDSHNDIPLLAHVEHPFVVDGDEKLIKHAKENQWPIISLR